MELIVVKEPGKAPEKRFVPKLGLEVSQAIVGGTIEYVDLNTEAGTLDLWLNEESKLERMTPNLARVHHGEVYDVLCGTVFVSKANEEGASTGLTEQEADAAVAAMNDITLTQADVAYYEAVIARLF